MTQNNWITLETTSKPYQLELMKGLLLEHEIQSVIINKIDSSYLQFGEAELKVKASDLETAKEILKEMQSGKFFTCEFIKKDGSNRVINCRTGVQKYTKGKGMSFDPMAKSLLSVYDIQKKGYRFINLSTLIWVQISGVKYWVSDLVIDESIKNIKELNKTILK